MDNRFWFGSTTFLLGTVIGLVVGVLLAHQIAPGPTVDAASQDKASKSASAQAIEENAKDVVDEATATRPEEWDKIADGKPMLVEFYATWCGTCQAFAPYIDQIEEEIKGKGAVLRLDVEKPENMKYNRQFNIAGTPTYVVYDGSGDKSYRSGRYLDPMEVREALWKSIGEPLPSKTLEQRPPRKLK